MSTSTADRRQVTTADPGPEAWSADARYLEYTTAADPIAGGSIGQVPVRTFGAHLYADGPTRVVPLDLSAELGCPGPATSPALCANFVRIESEDVLVTDVDATSQLFHVLAGRGWSSIDGRRLAWGPGDFLVLPAGSRAEHHADRTTCLYCVHDAPLLRYLGVSATQARFRPTHYPAADARRQLEAVAADPEAPDRNRISVLLANRAQEQTLTVTHVLWAMFGLLPAGAVQSPHRHQSVALDLVLDCQPGCYTLLGNRATGGELTDVRRVDWQPGSVFVTPPGMWHSHHNESGTDAHIVPIQDAGLHTFLRSLDIRFLSGDEAARALRAEPDGSSKVGATA